MQFKIIPAYNYPEQVYELFTEYTDMLIEGDPEFKNYLNLQNYDDELKHLEKKYEMPDGRLYLIYFNDVLAGCIGLRKIDDDNCEIKRLYVRPQFRRKHIGHILVEHIINDAELIGYNHILLDTLPFLHTAIQMYKGFGFYEIESYNNSPMDSLIYLKYDI